MALPSGKARRSPALAASREALVRVGPGQTTLTVETGPDAMDMAREIVRDYPYVVQGAPVAPYSADSPGSHAQATGRSLWTSLFSGWLGLALGQAARAADANGQSLTGRFVRERRDPPSDDQWWQPWELLHEPAQGGFLALATGRSIVRGPSETAVTKSLPAGRPLRVEVVVGLPPTLLPSLPFVMQEVGWLTEQLPALSQGQCVMTKAPPLPTAVAMLDHLATSEADVLHVLCTGWQGRLVAPEIPDDQFVPTAATRDVRLYSPPPLIDESALTERLQDSGVAMVVLNGCSVERTAEAISRSGTTVLAHRGDVSDEHAFALAEAFYPRLVAGQPTDLAIADARRTLEQRFPGQAAWATSTLFTSWPPARFHPPRRTDGGSEPTAYPTQADATALEALSGGELVTRMLDRNRDRLLRTGDRAWDPSWMPVVDQLALCQPSPGATS